MYHLKALGYGLFLMLIGCVMIALITGFVYLLIQYPLVLVPFAILGFAYLMGREQLRIDARHKKLNQK